MTAQLVEVGSAGASCGTSSTPVLSLAYGYDADDDVTSRTDGVVSARSWAPHE